MEVEDVPMTEEMLDQIHHVVPEQMEEALEDDDDEDD